MNTINEAMQTDIDNSVLCWLATADLSGIPNVSPKEIFSTYGDDRIVVADIASANSVRNIRANPSVCVSFIDIFRQRGFKIIGRAVIIEREEADFPVVGQQVLKMAGPDYPVQRLITIEISKISRIWAPSYKLFPERTETDRMQSAYDTYGVSPNVITE
ncbi:pyridoxamine 5'-phosphate oxidase family protein [Agrobacterium rubi]|uniref:pyridoxamine 5'-phosphate oxidase family protein n=1 Tax=Agrobacterium rubi TaxID=28099 RepID=UPI00191D363C|nr:pyridoxamine 5'-phosphate oxidase family protein [Agrobacterium rubi]